MGTILMLYKYSKFLRHLSIMPLILVRYWRSICTIVEMGNACNEHWDQERISVRLVHEATEKAHRAIIRKNNRLRLKEREEALQEEV